MVNRTKKSSSVAEIGNQLVQSPTLVFPFVDLLRTSAELGYHRPPQNHLSPSGSLCYSRVICFCHGYLYFVFLR